ncbi:hypothetical protein CMU99_16295 [Elizabethkingia anophelis]|nr:hypothetical protein [Elizabethkingia anophelis]
MKENIQRAVSYLEEAAGYAVAELANEPMLSLRVGNTVKTLVNGLKHVGGFVGTPTGTFETAVPEAKSFMGLDLSDLDKQKATAKVVVDLDEKEKYKQDVENLYASFLSREDNDLKDSVSRVLVLGVAKLAGIELDSDNLPKQVTLKLIREIKAAIEKKAEVEAEKEKTKDSLNVGNNEGIQDGPGNDDANTGSGNLEQSGTNTDLDKTDE